MKSVLFLAYFSSLHFTFEVFHFNPQGFLLSSQASQFSLTLSAVSPGCFPELFLISSILHLAISAISRTPYISPPKSL